MCHRVFMAALVTVLAYHIHNPDQAKPTKQEMMNWGQTISDLGILVQKVDDADLKETRELCLSLYQQVNFG